MMTADTEPAPAAVETVDVQRAVDRFLRGDELPHHDDRLVGEVLRQVEDSTEN